MSTPTTSPCEPTSFDAKNDTSAIPLPTSRTRMPGDNPASVSVGAVRRVRTAESLTHTVQRRTETGLFSRIMRLSPWTASATSPC